MKKEYLYVGFLALLWWLAILILGFLNDNYHVLGFWSMLIFAIVILGLGLFLPHNKP